MKVIGGVIEVVFLRQRGSMLDNQVVIHLLRIGDVVDVSLTTFLQECMTVINVESKDLETGSVESAKLSIFQISFVVMLETVRH